MAVRSPGAIAAQAAGATQDAAGNINIRGARGEGTVYFIDGVKVRGSVNLPQAAIQSTEIITGGLPAQYGDAVGGVINTTTRGPSGSFFGNAEILTSSYERCALIFASSADFVAAPTCFSTTSPSLAWTCQMRLPSSAMKTTGSMPASMRLAGS